MKPPIRRQQLRSLLPVLYRKPPSQKHQRLRRAPRHPLQMRQLRRRRKRRRRATKTWWRAWWKKLLISIPRKSMRFARLPGAVPSPKSRKSKFLMLNELFLRYCIWHFFQFDGNFESDVKSYAENGNSHASSGRTIFRSSHHVHNVLIEENPETTTKDLVCNLRNRWSLLWNRKRQNTAIKQSFLTRIDLVRSWT